MSACSNMLLVFWMLISLNYSSAEVIEAKCDCYPSPDETECKCARITQLDELFSSYPRLCSNETRKLSFEDSPNLESLNSTKLSESIGCNWSSIKFLQLNQTGLTRLDNLSVFRDLETLIVVRNHKMTSYSGQGLGAIGRHLTTLKLQANPVRSLTRSTFHGLQALEHLDLTANRIGHIERGTFHQNCCQNLRELILRDNFLTDLDSEIFKGLVNLELLDLHNNPLQNLDQNVFQSAVSTLTHLYMSYSDAIPFGGIKTPSPFLFHNLNKLRVLHMDELKIVNLTSLHFSNLSSLEILSLRGNRLTKLENNLFQSMIKLKHIDLSYNNLACIPSALNPHMEHDFLSGLTRLEWIDLSHNRLTHLNHLTVRSLGVFKSTASDLKRLVLKIDSNPWQHIDEDSFCNPTFQSSLRPVDLIVGPLSNSTFTTWRVSPGFWYPRSEWPSGPLSLIGPSGRIIGLAVCPTNTSRHEKLNVDETERMGYTDAVVGDENAQIHCDRLINSGSVLNNLTKIKTSKHNAPSASLIAFSIASYCPKLSIRELTRNEVNLLGIAELVTTVHSPHMQIPLSQTNSRLYLLVIVGICVAFLLVALTIIICYRAWSRQSAIDPSHESIVKPVQSIHDGPTEKRHLLTQIDQKEISVGGNLPRNGTVVQNVAVPNQPAHPLPIRNNPIRNGRPKSDSEAIIEEDIHELTAFGVV